MKDFDRVVCIASDDERWEQFCRTMVEWPAERFEPVDPQCFSDPAKTYARARMRDNVDVQPMPADWPFSIREWAQLETYRLVREDAARDGVQSLLVIDLTFANCGA